MPTIFVELIMILTYLKYTNESLVFILKIMTELDHVLQLLLWASLLMEQQQVGFFFWFVIVFLCGLFIWHFLTMHFNIWPMDIGNSSWSNLNKAATSVERLKWVDFCPFLIVFAYDYLKPDKKKKTSLFFHLFQKNMFFF